MTKSNWYSNGYLLAEKNSFYRKLLNQIPDLIFQLNIDLENIFYFSYVNSSVLTFFEISQSEIHHDPIEIITKRIYPEDRLGFFRSLYSAKNSKTSWSHEFRVQIGTKETSWVKVDATLEENQSGVVFFGRLSDISSIKKREFKVKDSEERYHFAMEASKSGVWDYDLTTGEVFFSKESLEIIQLTEQDKVATNALWDERIHPEDLENYYQSIALHTEDKIPYFENAKRVLAKDGNYKWILSRGKIIERDSSNVPLRIIGTHTDVTLEKEKEQQLLGNLDIISEQNNRLLNFAHIVSHNLRSHTGNFKMLLNIIENETDHVAKEECFTHLKTTSQALSETIEHLKELVDIHSTIVHKKEPLNLWVYLNRTLEIVSNEIKEQHVSVVNTIPKDTIVHFNAAYLDSILLNITTNAIRYSHPERNPIISYTVLKEPGKLALLIQDNGLGIDLEKYGEKLFGMYKTFHKNQNARGIGLFITKNQIESMGGTIEVESAVNFGSIFKIYFNEEA